MAHARFFEPKNEPWTLRSKPRFKVIGAEAIFVFRFRPLIIPQVRLNLGLFPIFLIDELG